MMDDTERLELGEALAMFVRFVRLNPQIDERDEHMLRVFAAYAGRLGIGPLDLTEALS